MEKATFIALKSALCGRKALHVALIAVLVVLVFSNTLTNRFNFDDPSVLLDNTAVHGLSAENIKKVFTSVPNSLEYLPVRDLSYMVDYELWGLNPFGYHLSNLIYYLAACLAMYFFLSRLAARWTEDAPLVAFLATLIFAVHPVHVESVAGIAQRKDLVMGFFSFMSLWLFLLYKNKQRKGIFALSLFFLALALLSKALAVVIPLFILLLNHVYSQDGKEKRIRRAIETAPYILVAFVITLVNFVIARGTGIVRPEGESPLERIPTALRAVFYYLKMLLFPYPLKMWHEFRISESFFELTALLALAATAALVYLAWRLKRNYRILSFSMAWYLLALLPVSGLLPTSTVIAERYLFLPSVGFALAIGWAFCEGRAALDKWKPEGAHALTVFFLIVVMVFSAVSISRNADWKNMETLLLSDLKWDPESYKINQTLGRYYFRNSNYEEAFRYFSELKKFEPKDADYEFHLALLLFNEGKYGEAENVLDGIRGKEIDFVDVHYLYGKIYQASGQYEKAMESYSRALESGMVLGIFLKRDASEAISKLNRETER
jgi:tetratricopeptide (TPR) repeat protein